jgi:hypothetical protein
VVANGTWPGCGDYTHPLSDDCGNAEHKVSRLPPDPNRHDASQCDGLNVEANRQKALAELLESLLTAIRAFSVGAPQHNDVTVLVLRYRAGADPAR